MYDYGLDKVSLNLVKELFNVNLLGAATQKVIHEDQHTSRGRVWVNYQWVAEISGWWINSVTVALMSYHSVPGKDLQKGVLLASKDISSNQFIGNQPARFIEMFDRVDSVTEALRKINLFEEPIWATPSNATHPSIRLALITPNGDRVISNDMAGGISDPTWIQLWEALLQTIRYLQVKYDDAKLNEYLDNPFDFRLFGRVPAVGLEKYLTHEER